jgi:hypothetical protein
MPKTPRPPALSIISSDATGGSPPRNLGRHGRALWDAIQRQYGIADTGGIEILAQVCGAVDVIESLGEAIERDGAIVYGRAGPKTHPGIKDQTALRALVCRGLERLGLNVEAIKPSPGRPPSPYGWTGGGT